MARWNSANVLQTMPGGRRLWRFSSKGSRFQFEQDATLTLSEPAPFAMVGKDWQSLVSPKLNVAWIPTEKVFLRAVQLPVADAAEIAAMVELQLEKLSPLPVTHIVWSLYLLPRPAGKPDALQTVIVIIALRAYVEEFLGELQGQGFLADRIEAPGLDQLLAAKMDKDGIWFFPGGPGEPALVAWYYGGTIQNLTLLPLPTGPERGALVKAHVEQIAWAGEMEGWLTGTPQIFLVATPAEAQNWMPLITPWSEKSVEVVPPLVPAELAARSAERTGGEGITTNLLPPEFSKRYHQQLVDRLWMRGIMAVAAVYLVGVMGYFAFLFEYKIQFDKARSELTNLGAGYTTANQNELQIQILKDRQTLKYAALDCWKAVAENLPESLTVDDMFFTRTKLDLHGTGSADQPDDVATFNDAMRHAQDAAHTGLLFSSVSPPTITTRGNKADWRFTCALRSTEAP